MRYQCTDCKKQMETSEDEVICACGRTYEKKDGVLIAWPSDMSKLAKEEVEYHDEFDENARDVHQLDAWRNLYYHQKLWDFVRQVPHDKPLLEIGAGSGTDTIAFADDYHIVCTDISPKTLARLDANMKKDTIDYVAADGANLPFAFEQFGGVYMSAVWHHIEDHKKALTEFARVLESGGRLAIGVEPNSFYFLPMKVLRPLLCRATHTDEHEGSHADAEMTGFSYKQIKNMFDADVWQDIQIQPMWLCAGHWHYFLEFLYRAFKLKNRIALPTWFEKFVVGCDEVLFKIPGVKHVGWHWMVFARKR